MKPYLILSLVIWITFSGRAQPSNAPLANFWIANNQVNAIVETKGVVYLGGNFTYVGPNTGPGGVVNATTGEPDTGWPRLSGDFATPYHWVTEAIPDGAGGWYVSGLFTRVGGLQREHVTRLLANKTVATNFNANVGSLNEVSTLALSGNTLYLGATRMVFPGAIVRNGLAAVDATTGALSSWNPKSSPDGEPWSVTSIAVMGNTVYFAGGFTNVGGQFRRNLAAVDATTGNPTAWTRDFTNSNFYALLASNNIVYVAGQIGITGPGISQVVMNLGAFDGTTGSTLWSVSVTNEGSQRFISALALSGNTLYVGGRFTSIAGVSRRSLAALNATTGTVLPWNPSANLGGGFIGVAIINGLAVSGNTVYVGGDIGFAGGQPRFNLAALNATTGNALSGFQAGAAKQVSTVALSGNLLYAGCISGGGDSIGGVGRNGLAALNATTGAATSWNPSSNSLVRINALAVSNDTVYVGGIFTNIGGVVCRSIAAVDASTGAVFSWDPSPYTTGSSPPEIKSLLLSGNLLYVGGTFTNIGGQVRRYIAALTNSTATASPWNPGASFTVNTMALDGGTLYVGGGFSSIGGSNRNSLAALDTTVGNATGWNPNPNVSQVNAIAVGSNTVYVGGGFTTIGGSNRTALAALDSGSGLATAWNPTASGVQGLALTSNSLFVAGNFATIGGSNRSGRAELNLTAGAATAWNPTNFVSNSGTGTGQGQVVALGAANVYAGGLFPGYFAAYARGLSSPPAVPPTLSMPAWNGGVFGFRMLGSDGVSHAIDASLDFQSWTNIATVVPSGGFHDFTDLDSALHEWRFYRARVGP